MDLHSGSGKIGHYKILREIGRGSQGHVFLAEDIRLARRVALKVLSTSFARSSENLRRFRREAEVASRVDHPGICSVYEAGEADGHHFIAMRYVHGETLAHRLVAQRSSPPRADGETVVLASSPRGEAREENKEAGERDERPAPTVMLDHAEIIKTVHLMERAARALHAAHESGLIHRDIKPGNIMITKEGRPVILDFGLARSEDSDFQSLTQSGDLLGTPAYMSPEQLSSHRVPVDRRTDVYSLGVTLYECVTLNRPFDATSRETLYRKILSAPLADPTRINPKIPRDLKVVIETAVEKDRDRRYKTALELAEDLRRVRLYEPIQARPAGALLRFRRWTQRNPVLATAILGAFLILSTGLGVALVLLEQVELARIAAVNAGTTKDEALKARALVLEALQAESNAKEEALVARQIAFQRAESSRLTAEAGSVLEESPGTALLLALEAANREKGPVLNNVLVDILRVHREDRMILGPYGRVGELFLKEDGSFLLMHTWGGLGARVYDLGTGKLISLVRDLTDTGWVAAFSPDGELMVTAPYMTRTPEARLWSTTTGEYLGSLRGGHTDLINSVTFDASGRNVITASEDSTVRIWDLETGKRVQTLRVTEGGVTQVEVAKDGKRLLAVSTGASSSRSRDPSGRLPWGWGWAIRVWDVDTGKSLHEARGLPPGTVVAALSPNGRYVAQASNTGGKNALVLKDLAADREIPLMDARDLAISNLTFDPGSSRLVGVVNGSTSHLNAPGLAASGHRFVAHVWNIENGVSTTKLVGHDNLIRSVSFSADGRRIVTGSNDNTARVWHSRTGELLTTLRGHEAGVTKAYFTADGKNVTTVSLDKSVRVWNVDMERAFATLPFAPQNAQVAVFNNDGNRLLTATGPNGTVWDVSTQAGLGVVGPPISEQPGILQKIGIGIGTDPKAEKIQDALFSPDGNRLLVKLASRTEIWGDDGWGLISVWRPESFSTRIASRFSPDGKYVVSTQASTRAPEERKGVFAVGEPARKVEPDQFEAVLWEASTGTVIWTLRGHPNVISGIEFSADSRRLLTWSRGALAKLWDVETGALLHETELPQGRVWTARFKESEAKLLVSGTRDTLYLTTLDEGSEAIPLTGHLESLTDATFSLDGTRVLTVSRDRTARIWSVTTGEPLYVLEGHKAPLLGASFSNDGTLAVTFAEDQTARVWSVWTGKEVISLRHDEPILSASMTADNRSVQTVSESRVPRLWPLDPVEEARLRKSRELTPREMELFEISTPEEREAYARGLELRDLVGEVEARSSNAASAEVELNRPTTRVGTLNRLESLIRGQFRSGPDLTSAEETVRSAMESSPRKLPELLGALGLVLSLQGKKHEAVRLFEDAVHLEPSRWLVNGLARRRVEVLPDLTTYASIDAALENPEPLVPFAAEWRYWKGVKAPSAGLEWTEARFEDSSWTRGPAGFGYGDDDDATVLQDMMGNYTTLYLRHKFHFADPSRLESLRLTAYADDGFVAYLNGREIARSLASKAGMTVSPGSVADREVSESPFQPTQVSLEPSLLLPGANLLAVVGLNRSKSSPDFTLQVRLSGTYKSSWKADTERFEAFRSVATGADREERLTYLEARILARAGEHREAIAKLLEVVLKSPLRPEPLLHLVESMRATNDAARAEEKLRDALRSSLHGSEAVWETWFQVATADLGQSTQELLRSWPPTPSDDPLAPGSGLRWALEQLELHRAIRLRAGQGEVREPNGVLWAADRFFKGGVAQRFRFRPEISGTSTPELYRSHRWFGPYKTRSGYRIPVPRDTYRVRLHFAEMDFDTPRSRVFGVKLEGTQVLKSFDVVAKVGPLTAHTEAFELRVLDGFLDIEFTHEVNNPAISAIEVEPSW